MSDLRTLRLDQAKIDALLDQLDAEQPKPNAEKYYAYRLPRLPVHLLSGGESRTRCELPSRCIGQNNLRVLYGSLCYPGTRCEVNLLTVDGRTTEVRGGVAECRYLLGTAGIHELTIHFDRPLDPALYAVTAVRTSMLVVDDSQLSRQLMAHQLARLNAEVETVASGDEAVDAAIAKPYDVILMDYLMPRLDGVEAVQTLRTRGYVRPIVIMTSMSGAELAERCLMAGCDELLTKPIEPATLERLIQRYRPVPVVSSLLADPGMAPLIDSFVAGLPHRVRQLATALAAQELGGLVADVRILKGEAGGFGFEAITAAARELEQVLSGDRDPLRIRVLFRSLLRYCLAARPATLQTGGQPTVEAPPEIAAIASPEPEPKD